MAFTGKAPKKPHSTALVPACKPQASRASEEVLYTKLAKDSLTCSLLALRMSKDLNSLLHQTRSYGAAACRLRRVCCTRPSLVLIDCCSQCVQYCAAKRFDQA